MAGRSLAALALAAALVSAAPAGGAASPAAVVRAWAQALNRDDNESAARLFAPNAKVLQGPFEFVLYTHRIAVTWNSGLPCSGKITSLSTSGITVRAEFLLGERPHHRCDGPGMRAAAVIRIRQGKIVFWQQVPAASNPMATA